jgi:hypothetical protein
MDTQVLNVFEYNEDKNNLLEMIILSHEIPCECLSLKQERYSLCPIS